MFTGISWLSAALALFIPSAALAQNSFDSWAALASQEVTSPAASKSPGQHLRWNAPDGRTVSLAVLTPAISSLAVTLGPVPQGADARPYFDAALAQVRAEHANTLVIPTGTYVFSSLGYEGLGHLVIHGLQDVTIAGQGSTLIFTQNQPGVYLTQSQRVQITGLHIQYNLHMASLGTIEQKNGQNVLVIDGAYPVSSADKIGHLAQYDRSAKGFVLGGQTMYMPPGASYDPVYVGNQTYTSPSFQGSKYVNMSFVVFHHWYGGAAIVMEDSPSPGQLEDITLNNVSVNSGPGMGIVAYGIKRGLGIWNTRVVAKPGALISTEYDAMHILIVGGDVSLIGNTIANQGDDGINLNDPISPVVSTDGTGVKLVLSTYSRFMSTGDTLAFFDSSNNFLGTATITSALANLGGLNDQYRGMTIDHAIAGLSNTSVVRDVALIDSRIAVEGNVIRDCQCHGILVQTPNTLVSGNRFSNTVGSAINMLTNIGNFVEGVGAINVIASGNTITNTGTVFGISGMPWSAINLYGVNARVAVSSVPVNKYVQIANNTISGAFQGCITMASSELVSVTGNLCQSDNMVPSAIPGASILSSNSITFQQNQRTGSTSGLYINSSTTSGIVSQTNF